MATATITFTDTPEDLVNVTITFDPEVTDGSPQSQAQYMAGQCLTAMVQSPDCQVHDAPVSVATTENI